MNGIDITPIIPKTVLNWSAETVGLLINHGSGNVITIQITPKRIISLALKFFLTFHNILLWWGVLNSCEFI